MHADRIKPQPVSLRLNGYTESDVRGLLNALEDIIYRYKESTRSQNAVPKHVHEDELQSAPYNILLRSGLIGPAVGSQASVAYYVVTPAPGTLRLSDNQKRVRILDAMDKVSHNRRG